MNLEQQIENHYGLSNVICEQLNTRANDVIAVTTPSGRFALKLYHLQRTTAEVQWELDLIIHLMRNGAPVANPVLGKHGYVELCRVDERDRVVALFEWAPGEKPAPERDTYTLLGKAPLKYIKRLTHFSLRSNVRTMMLPSSSTNNSIGWKCTSLKRGGGSR